MSQIRKGAAAYVGNPGTPMSEWKQIGYLSEGDAEWAVTRSEIAQDLRRTLPGLVQPRMAGKNTLFHRYDIPIAEAHFERGWLDLWEAEKSLRPDLTAHGIQEYLRAQKRTWMDDLFGSIPEELRGFDFRETETDVLQRRLNARWRDHRHPDSRVHVIVREGGRQYIPHAFMTPTDTLTPMPVPSVDDPNYYLRNPS